MRFIGLSGGPICSQFLVAQGFGILSGTFVLFVMILPTVTFMTTDTLRTVPLVTIVKPVWPWELHAGKRFGV